MNRFYFGEDGKGKLVRDKCDDIVIAQGHKAKTKELETKEISRAIIGKIPEELKEILEAVECDNRAEIVEELADLKSLTDSLSKVLDISQDEICQAEETKSNKKGRFENGVFMEYVELYPEGDDYEFWLDYYRSNSDRYIEK